MLPLIKLNPGRDYSGKERSLYSDGSFSQPQGLPCH